MEKNKIFVAAINCMDGRVQDPVQNWLIQNKGAVYIDMITEPGPDKLLAENTNIGEIEDIKNKLAISIKKHGSKVIAIAAHPDCAGNPVTKEEHVEHLKKAREVIKGFGFDAEIIMLWVNEDWKSVEEIFF